MKLFLALPFILLPFIATAEATGGYSYGSGFVDDIIGGVVVVVIVIVVAFFIFIRRK